jgi:hypothetical protein
VCTPVYLLDSSQGVCRQPEKQQPRHRTRSKMSQDDELDITEMLEEQDDDDQEPAAPISIGNTPQPVPEPTDSQCVTPEQSPAAPRSEAPRNMQKRRGTMRPANRRLPISKFPRKVGDAPGGPQSCHSQATNANNDPPSPAETESQSADEVPEGEVDEED